MSQAEWKERTNDELWDGPIKSFNIALSGVHPGTSRPLAGGYFLVIMMFKGDKAAE